MGVHKLIKDFNLQRHELDFLDFTIAVKAFQSHIIT